MILSKLKLVENIVNEISDNSTGLISPHDIRHNLLDIIDSVHLLTLGKPLAGSNFETPLTRTTRAGISSIEKLGLEGYFSVDNSAFGYAALQANYQGVRNTALGSNALTCNIYGSDNVAVGTSSLGGNTTGFGNVGLGNYALSNQKSGHFNVAIGHAAGYYVDRETSNKLFIASHELVGEEYICDNPLGEGLIPLIHGDFKELKLGIGVRNLGIGTLQVAGDILPSPSGNLGHISFPWSFLYSNNIRISSTLLSSNNSNLNGSLALSGNFQPLLTNVFNLGSSSHRWNSAHFNSIVVDRADIQRLVSYENCEYSCKTITLGSNKSLNIVDGGGPQSVYEYQFQDTPDLIDSGFDNCVPLTDEELEGAGFIVAASGLGYARTYRFNFIGPDYGLSCLQDDNPYSRSSWNSNISIHIASGSHLMTDRVVFPKNISLVSASGCHGVFSRNKHIFFSSENVLRSSDVPSSSGHIAGISNVNFLATSGDVSDYVVNISALESGVSVAQRFLTATKQRIKEPSSDKDKLIGFELQYIDGLSGILGNSAGRFVIGSYDDKSEFDKALTLVRRSSDEGIFGINNFAGIAKHILPDTAINVRSINNAVARLTAENGLNTKSALQLLGKSNCLENGFEIEYFTASGIADISTYKDSGKFLSARFYPQTSSSAPKIAFFPDFNNVSGQHMLHVGSETFPHAAVSIYEFKPKKSDIFLEYSTLSNFPTIGEANKFYIALDTVKSYTWNPEPLNPRYVENDIFPKSSLSGCVHFLYKKFAPNQSQTIFAIDSSGNRHDLFVNKFDHIDARALYTDKDGNTYGGFSTTLNRQSTLPKRNTLIGNTVASGLLNAFDNTFIGYNNSQHFINGSGNTIVGANSMKGARSAQNNTIIGNNSFIQSSGNSNIVLGNNSFNFVDNSSNNIVIGNNGVGNATSGNFHFLVGSNSGNILMHGTLGPNNVDKKLIFPSGGRIFLNNDTDSESLSLKPNYIDVLDYGGSDYPENELSFRFLGNNSATLLTMNHVAPPIINNPNYFVPTPPRPYIELKGDLRLKGGIRFNDGTSLASSSFLNNISDLASGLVVTNSGLSGLKNTVNELIIEGYVPNKINAPSSAVHPTSGIMMVKGPNWSNAGNVFLINRDATSVIHSGAYVIAIKVNNEYKPLWISAADTSCCC